MTDKDKALREKYVEKMRNHDRQSAIFRKKIDLIDQKDKEEFRDKMIGKCFRQNSGTKQKPSWHGYARVDYFDEHFSPYGTIVNWYEEEKTNEKVMYSVEIKHHLFTDWLLNGKKISTKEFEQYLKDVKALI